MSRRRVFHPRLPPRGSVFELNDTAANHLARVLRLTTGDELVVFDGKGNACSARIEECGRRGVTLRAGEQVAGIPESALAVTLLQGISRSNRMDAAIQKATELGVAEIRPVVTERSVVQLDERRAVRRLSHWRQIAISACEQCGRDTVPKVRAPAQLGETIADQDLPATRILLHAGADGGLTDIPPADMKLALIAGPEGGLTEGEITECEAHRFVQAGLGPRILRTETAPLAALAILQYRFGDLV